MATTTRPGLLHVTMQPHSSLHPAQFHDWYNNEHGPWRLRYPFFLNGFRYRATDLPASHGSKELPEWVAIYDVVDMSEMLKAPYTDLRKKPMQSQREMDTMSQIHVDRRFFDLVATKVGSGFQKLEHADLEGKGNSMVAISFVLHPGKEDEWKQWNKDIHLPAVEALPGWTRTRHFETATVDTRPEHEILFLHEFEPSSGSASKAQFEAFVSKSSSSISSTTTRIQIRTYALYYTFGPAPRELGALAEPSYRYIHEHAPHCTRTIPSSTGFTGLPAIESYVKAPDGTVLPYTLTGSSEPSAPVIVLSNSILTHAGIWSDFLIEFFAKPENRKYRVLSYSTRGRSNTFSSTTTVTADVLAEDVIHLLNALRIKKAKAIIGVSLGGVTALCCGMRHSQRFEAFVSCDTMPKSLPGTDQVWKPRIAVCEAEGSVDASSGEQILGADMAEATTRRWFSPEAYDGGKLEEKVKTVSEMVRTNTLDGFKASVQALDMEDMNKRPKSERIKGMFLVGMKDGVLPPVMRKMAEALEGSKFVGIENAGHLPMVEKPKEVADAVSNFLAQT
ncbi:putative alpha/beta hydrolase [Stagonosporopsis vannaccii]|nr:putative alpha/beta hydrolase [Stagonosporopsis vannaccii]